VAAQRPAALGCVVGAPAVLIQVRQNPLAQHRQLAGVERAGVADSSAPTSARVSGPRCGGMRARTERITAVVGSLGSTGAPLSPRRGSTSPAAEIRARASLRGIRAITRTNSTVLPYPTPGAIARASIPATTESIYAQVECNQVSNAPSSASTSASLLCHTTTVDITPL
jgi:hypothetical protein